MGFLIGAAVGLVTGIALAAYYWWRSDQIQAETLEGWEWQRRSGGGRDAGAEAEFVGKRL